MSSIKTIYHGDKATQKLLSGVRKMSDAVTSTLGPGGRNVIIEPMNGATRITKDGVTVAKEVFLKDDAENVAASILREAAMNAGHFAGDGTTTATLLAHQIVEQSFNYFSTHLDVNQHEFSRGLTIASEEVKKLLEEHQQTIDPDNESDVKNVAVISANNDEELGALIAEAVTKAGKYGTVSVRPSRIVGEQKVEMVDGTRFDCGWNSPYFINNPQRKTFDAEDCHILISEKRIVSVDEIKRILEYNYKSKGGNSLVILAPEFSEMVFNIVTMNLAKGEISNVCLVKPRWMGEKLTDFMQDMAALTGAKFVSKLGGLDLTKITPDDFGTVEHISISDKEMTFRIGKYSQTAKNYINTMTAVMEEQIKSEVSEQQQELLRERMARLQGKVGVLNVNANSAIEMEEKKDRIEDAFHATRAAIEEGIVPGGGCALLRISKELENDFEGVFGKLTHWSKEGARILLECIKSPIEKILSNGGYNASLIEEIKTNVLANDNFNFGFNLKKREYVDLIKDGVVDPKKVTRIALESAVSVSSTLVTTSCLMVPIREQMMPQGQDDFEY